MKKIFTFLLLSAAGLTAMSQTTYTIREDGTEADFNSISAAMESGDVVNGDTLDIMGTFTEANIQLKKAVVFKGNGEDNTIIQAAESVFDATDRVFYHANTEGFPGGDGVSIAFENLTIQNGHAFTGFGGGAIQILGQVDVEFNNVTIKDCKTSAGNGGAIYFWGRYLSINETEIENCESVLTRCGGLYVHFQQGYDQVIDINSSLFMNNKALDHGGAMSFMTWSDAAYTAKKTINITNSTFYGNRAVSGSLFWIEQGNATGDFVLNMTNNTVVNNVCTGGWLGCDQFWGTPEQKVYYKFTGENNFFKGNINEGTDVPEVGYVDWWTPDALGLYDFKRNVGHYIFLYEVDAVPTGYTYFENDTLVAEENLPIDLEPTDNGGNIRTIALEEGNVAIEKVFNGVLTTDARGLARKTPYSDAGAFETQPEIGVSTSKIVNESIAILQNPVNDYLKFANHQTGVVNIYNVTGKLVKSFDHGIHSELNVSDLNSGLYIVNVNGKKTAKFVKN